MKVFGLLFLVVNVLAAAAVAADGIEILPRSISLSGSEARQQLLVQTMRDGQYRSQLVEGVTFSSSDTKIVRIEKGVALPVGNGKAVITAKVGKQTATVEVTVQQKNQTHRWSFRNHVQPVLAKAGCSVGACHGALAGKNGFKLSLRGYDPEADFFTITRQSRGRRVVPDDPGRSLLLTKPTAAIPHKGGLRFRTDSHEYRVLSEWIAAGQTPPKDDDARMTRLEILPENTVLKSGDTQQIVVLAHFSDGHVEDVTRGAKYTATNLTVANVDEDGEVTVTGHGEGSLVAWYLSRNVIASLSVPYPSRIDPQVFAKAERSNFIDDIVLEKLQALNIPPSGKATDSEFLRRAYLDTTGVLPTIAETRKFLSDKSPDKRAKLANALLGRKEFVDYWTYKWADLLLVSGARLRPKAVDAYYAWIRKQVEQNTPWNEFARQVVTAKGSTVTNGAANFYSLHQDPHDMAETVSMAFLGMSIGCARCHDHPLERWTNDDYYGMASLFSRVRGKGWGGDFRSGDGVRVVFHADEGELIQPRTGRAQQPRPLDGQTLSYDAPGDRRDHLAKWLTSPQNPYFNRAITNRVWTNFMGVGIVENVDDLRLTNPPSNEKLLSALSDNLAKNNYDLKKLMRLILTSQAYQRSSRSLSDNAADTRFYSRFYARRLQAEVLLDAISQASGTPTKFKDYPAGTRALQLRDANVASYFLKTFGRPERIITCDCERSDEPSMVQVLHIVNGSTLNDKLAAKESRVAKQLATKADNATLVDNAYLAALSRFPTADENSRILKVLAETPDKDRRLALEDLYWGILSSREFLFNH
jgi:hypothetical protein